MSRYSLIGQKSSLINNEKRLDYCQSVSLFP